MKVFDKNLKNNVIIHSNVANLLSEMHLAWKNRLMKNKMYALSKTCLVMESKNQIH